MEKNKNHKTRLKHQTSNTFKSHGGEKNNGKSLTVQDESYTIRELLEKHANGLMPPVGLNPEYDYEEPTFEDDVTFRKPDLDLTDIEQMSKKVKRTQTHLAEGKEANAKKAKAKAIENEVKEQLKAEGKTSEGEEGTK